MNYAVIKRLIYKDWYLIRWTILGYLSAGVLAVSCIATGNERLISVGNILLLTVVIALGMHVVITTVVGERATQTLPFLISLPISTKDYTTAKILANMLIFLVPWLTLLIAIVGVILGRDSLPDGLIPYTIIIQTELLVSYCFVLATALVSESQGWTIGATLAGNLFFQAFLSYVSQLPGITATIGLDTITWNQSAILLLVGEALAIVVLLVGTFLLQARKTDFI
ncbi:ABC-2 transporter permease [Herpetosiphon gulosus]|uniref:ABC transporter permease n=1 Tax=Herpetosiphon gulosus TaxID=1973496 RepID=A0ABP9X834_9CHLR